TAGATALALARLPLLRRLRLLRLLRLGHDAPLMVARLLRARGCRRSRRIDSLLPRVAHGQDSSHADGIRAPRQPRHGFARVSPLLRSLPTPGGLAYRMRAAAARPPPPRAQASRPRRARLPPPVGAPRGRHRRSTRP